MARTTRTTDSEIAFVRRSLGEIDEAKVTALIDAWVSIAEDVESNDLDLRDVLSVGLHNLTVVIHRDPTYKVKVTTRGLEIARAAQAEGETGRVMISPNVSPKRYAYLSGPVERIDGDSVTVRTWDGPVKVKASLITRNRNL
jgi:hypothetical protein